MRSSQKVAIVHDWLDTYRGGEKVLEEILSIFPDAPIFTLFYNPRDLPESITRRRVIYPAFLNRFASYRKALLPILPSQIEAIDLNPYDLVISTSSCVAKGVLTHPNAKHICYIHSPMRYIWDQREHYLGGIFRLPIIGFIAKQIATRLRIWDVTSSGRVDRFVANSSFVQRRVEKYYGRSADVLHPPVDVARFSAAAAATATATAQAPAVGTDKPYCLIAGAFVRYKRMDIAIEACNRLGVTLIVAGSGPEEAKLRRLAGPTVSFEISPNKSRWAELMRGSKALLYPGVEDFGIVPIEAMAAGVPVIAFRGGGALDYLIEGRNGVFFDEQTPESLAKALDSLNEAVFDESKIRESAMRFSAEKFRESFKEIVDEVTG